MPPDIWPLIVDNGLPFVFMALAVWWLQKGNRELVSELNKERSERLDAMEKHITDCDKDRKDLRDMLIRHLAGQP